MKPAEAPRTIAAYMDERVNDLRLLVPRALIDFDEEAVHDARVATRRLTAAVGLLSPVLSDSHRKTFEKALRKLRKRLGPLRDLDVILHHLADLAAAKKFPAAIDWLRQQLTDQRADLRDEQGGKQAASKSLARLGEWWALHPEVDDAAEAVDSLLGESVHHQLDLFAEQADRLTAPATVGGPRQDPHPLRIAGKSLRYTLELAGVAGHRLPAGVLKSFKSMQESLGHWHDMVVLSETVLRVALKSDLPLHDPTTASQVLDLGKLALNKSGRTMGAFSSHWTESGRELADSIRHAFPLAQPNNALSGSKTDPDPAGSDESQAKETPSPDAPTIA